MPKFNLPKIRSILLVSLLFYGGWWGIVFSASQNHPFLPLLIAGGCTLANFLITGPNLKEALWILIGLLLGFSFDSILQTSGLLTFSHQFHALLAPLWIAALWALFSSAFLTLQSFQGFGLQFLFGAIGGPLSYFVGTKFDLIVYPQPQWLYIGLHSLLWGLFFPLLMGVHKMLHMEKLPSRSKIEEG